MGRRLTRKPEGWTRSQWDRYCSCESKRKIGNEQSAEARAKRDGMRHYRCLYCGFWHTTSR